MKERLETTHIHIARNRNDDKNISEYHTTHHVIRKIDIFLSHFYALTNSNCIKN